MAQKRMFDRAIIDTDKFMDMPMSTKALYFLLGMEADDEGFVSYKKVVKIHGGTDDDVKLLIAKSFVIVFESGVVVITDWMKNNWLDSRRIKPTEYQKERQMLGVSKDGRYLLSNGLARGEESRVEQRSIGAVATQPTPAPEKVIKSLVSDQDTGDGSSVEPDDENVPTSVLKRKEAIRSGYKGHLTAPIREWGEIRLGHKFTTRPKQDAAIAKMLRSGFSVEQIQNQWTSMEKDPFWSGRGFDFSNVCNEIGKMKNTSLKREDTRVLADLVPL